MRWGNTSRPGWCLEQNPPFLCGAAVDAALGAQGPHPLAPLVQQLGEGAEQALPAGFER